MPWVASQPALTPHRGGTLTVLSQQWVDTFDPALTQSAGGALDLTNDGLTAYERVGGSRSMHVVPDLAVSLPTPTDGGTTYTFQLRPGIHYSNGEPVLPEDFRRALERDLILRPNAADNRPFANVVGAAACAANPSHCDLSRGVVTDDIIDAVTFHLVAPDPQFLTQLTLPDAFAVPAGTPTSDIAFTRYRPPARTCGPASRTIRPHWCATHTFTSGPAQRARTATPTGSCSAAPPFTQPKVATINTASGKTCFGTSTGSGSDAPPPRSPLPPSYPSAKR